MQDMTECVFCNHDALRSAEVVFETDHCMYASTRDPRDPPDVLPGCGIIVTFAHKPSPFDFSPDEWADVRELLLQAKGAWDERLAPDGYLLAWNAFPDVPHAHLHVIPRFDDEPRAEEGARSAIKVAGNRRPDPAAPGNGRAKALGP
jgi:diadenosine tetraphosphate (Ap4A) HIT family hydrolase